jgi:hypothetical protein
MAPPQCGSAYLNDTIIIIIAIIIIVVVIISLTLYFLPIVIGVQISREDVVKILEHWICTRPLEEEF